MFTKQINQTDFNPSITGYFRNMSFSNFIIYGDAYPQSTVYPKLYQTSFGFSHYQVSPTCTSLVRTRDVSTAVWEAITRLDNEIDYSQYDNDNDGYVDELIVWFRLGYFGLTDCSTYNGIANLTGVQHNDFIDEFGNHLSEIITNDGTKIKNTSGLIADGPGRNGTAVMVHEIGHTMGFGHYWHAGRWNMMGARAGVGIMNTWERNDYCNWLPTNSVQTIGTPGTYSINLTDFETTGKSVILNTYNNGGRYVIENRSGISYYSRLGSWIMPDNGIVITYYPFNTSPYYISVECADHKWLWAGNSGAVCGSNSCENNFNFTFDYPFTKLQPSINGIKDLDLRSVCTTNGCLNNEGAGGNYGDAFKIGYNQVFSHWSNPDAFTGVNGQPICIDVLNHNADSSYDILIKYDVASAYNETHPSKPLWLRCSKYYFNPFNPKVFHPKLEWLANTEPDIKGYKILRGQITDQSNDPQYYLLATLNSGAVTSWIDNDITLYENGGGSGVCTLLERTYAYRIIAFDTESPEKESVRSERSTINGFIDPCAPVLKKSNEIPLDFALLQNYPNPFNPSTEINFELPQNTFVTLIIYNSIGEEVARLVDNEYKNAGRYSVNFDGSKLASGIYFYSIDAGAFKDVKKMVLIK